MILFLLYIIFISVFIVWLANHLAKHDELNDVLKFRTLQLEETHKKYCGLQTEVAEKNKEIEKLKAKLEVKNQQVAAFEEKQVKKVFEDELRLIENKRALEVEIERLSKMLKMSYDKILDHTNHKIAAQYDFESKDGGFIRGAFTIYRAYIGAHGEPIVEFVKCLACGDSNTILNAKMAEFHYLSHQSPPPKEAA